MLYLTEYVSPVGRLTLAAKDECLVGLWIEGQKFFISPAAVRGVDLPVFRRAAEWLDSYFTGGKPSPGDICTAPEGSDFRREVWEILADIPYGEVTAYGDIAKTIASRHSMKKMSAQAVGGAVGHNPLSIIIPCHRVIGSDGSLTGYAGGIDKKIWLLTHEGVDISALSAGPRRA